MKIKNFLPRPIFLKSAATQHPKREKKRPKATDQTHHTVAVELSHLSQGCLGFSDRAEPEESRGPWEPDRHITLHRARTKRGKGRGYLGQCPGSNLSSQCLEGRDLL